MSSSWTLDELRTFLDKKVAAFNRPEFIAADPISIPHLFQQKPDIEIAGFFAATIAWGQRTTILQNCRRILDAMDYAPYDFIMHHEEQDLKRFLDIQNRTFQATDLLYMIHFFRWFYARHESLEEGFCFDSPQSMYDRLVGFRNYFFSIEHPQRTEKHVATPAKNSACKRLNMFLRWMVRKDNGGVDFGHWNQINMNELICPLDTHVYHVAVRLGLLEPGKADWKHAVALTSRLRDFNADDPVRYDFALFGLGIEERFR